LIFSPAGMVIGFRKYRVPGGAACAGSASGYHAHEQPLSAHPGPLPRGGWGSDCAGVASRVTAMVLRPAPLPGAERGGRDRFFGWKTSSTLSFGSNVSPNSTWLPFRENGIAVISLRMASQHSGVP